MIRFNRLLAAVALTSLTGLVGATNVHGQVVTEDQWGPVVVNRPGWVNPSYYYPQRYPVIVTQPQLQSVSPLTGAINTTNTQIDNSAFDPYRNQSQFNGTRHWVNRPVFDTMGRQIGYEEGWVWYNSATGQEHGNLRRYTPNHLNVNGMGPTGIMTTSGIHSQSHIYGGGGTSGIQETSVIRSQMNPQGYPDYQMPSGVHTQQHQYGGGGKESGNGGGGQQ